MTKSRPHCMR